MHIKFLFLYGFVFFSSVQAMDQNQQNKCGKKRTRDESILISFSTDEHELVRRIIRIEETSFEDSKVQKRPFIIDAYTWRRGEPKMLELCCNQCDTRVMDYQKDGPGQLLRCYLDRIHSPYYLKKLQQEPFDVLTADFLKCPHCRSVVGKPMIYRQENRSAFWLFKGKFFFKET